MEIILKYFPELSARKLHQLALLESLYKYWNQRINVISRKDLPNLYERHVLHSMSLAKMVGFKPGFRILDVGTGGGFPGIPLAILFPESEFILIDSIGKKIRVVQEIAASLNLVNLTARQERAERLNGRFEYVVSRAVTGLPVFYKWVNSLVVPSKIGAYPNGILYLKGGNLKPEIKSLPEKTRIVSISTFFREPFFETKKIVFIPF